MTDLIKKIILTAAVLFSGIAPAAAHKDTSFNSPHKLELKPASFSEPGYQLAKSYWLGGADIDLGFKGDDDETVCRSRGYKTDVCGTNQIIVSYCGAGNQYHRCGCDDRIYRYDDITCGSDAYPDMSDEYVCNSGSSGGSKSDRCICRAEDEQWIDGRCVFYCSKDSHCGDDEICITSTGQCEFKDCEIYGCDNGQVCYNHSCEVPNCVNGGTSCVQGEKCDSVSKQCVEDPNTCPAGYQDSACSDKQISDGSNHTTSTGKVCYACRAKTCDDLNCDSVRQTCNSAALICVDKAGCSDGYSTAACTASQEALGSYVADNGDTCYKCQELTCQGQLEAAGYGVDGAVGRNGTSVITKNITLNNFTSNAKYISLKGLSFSKCQYTGKPKVILTQTTPVLTAVSMDNLIVSGSGSAVMKGTARVTDVDFIDFPYLDIGGHDFVFSNVTFEGTVTLPNRLLTIYRNATLHVNGHFSSGEASIKEGGILDLSNVKTFTTVSNINVNTSGTLTTRSSTSSNGGTIRAEAIYVDGSADFNYKTVTAGTEIATYNGGSLKVKNSKIITEKWDFWVNGGVFDAEGSTLSLKGNFIVKSGATFKASNTTISATHGKLYNGAAVTIANKVNLNFSGRFSCAVSKITLGTCDSLSPQNNDDYGISANEFELGQVDGSGASNTQISLCGGSMMKFSGSSGVLNQYNNAKICLEYWATFYCSGNIHGEGLKQSWIKGQTGFTWSNCKKKYSTSNDKC